MQVVAPHFTVLPYVFVDILQRSAVAQVRDSERRECAGAIVWVLKHRWQIDATILSSLATTHALSAFARATPRWKVKQLEVVRD